jgi:hypothetical protein
MGEIRTNYMSHLHLQSTVLGVISWNFYEQSFYQLNDQLERLIDTLAICRTV